MRIPGPKWGAGRPPLETPKSRCAIRIGRTPRRLRGWSFGAVGESASACALATAAAPPPLRVGASPPCPLRSPKGKVCRSRAPVGAALPGPLRSPKGKLADHARQRMVPRPIRLASNAPANLPEAPAAQRLGVPSLSSRGCAEGTLARPQRGNPKGGAALFGQSLPTFCWPESRGPARPERVKGKIRNLRRHKRDNKRLPERKPAPAACEVPRRGKRVEGKRQNFKQTQRG